MELCVRYQCSKCDQKLSQSLLEFRPGQQRDCIDCGSPVTLTDESLTELREAVHEAYRH